MPSDSTKTLYDLRGKGLFSIGGGQKLKIFGSHKKAVDACREVVPLEKPVSLLAPLHFQKKHLAGVILWVTSARELFKNYLEGTFSKNI